jgi:hypothetical protein
MARLRSRGTSPRSAPALALASSLRLVAPLAALASPLCTASVAEAEEPEAFARVTVDAAELRSGPGVSFRVIYTAHRGETLALDGRPGTGFWLRVILADGRTAYALGDELQTFAVDPNDKSAPSRPGVLAPPPLTGSRAGLAILGGAAYVPLETGGMHAYGYIEARPSIVVDRTVTLDAFVGDVLTSNGSEVLYGGGASIYIAPTWPVCPYLELGGGGFSVFPNSDSFVLKRADYYLARAGGGFLLAFRSRILVRFEVTNLTLFNAQSYTNAQTFAGGLGVYF